MARAVIVPQIDQMAALSQAGTNRSDKDDRGEDEADGELVSLFVRSIMLCLPAKNSYRPSHLTRNCSLPSLREGLGEGEICSTNCQFVRVKLTV